LTLEGELAAPCRAPFFSPPTGGGFMNDRMGLMGFGRFGAALAGLMADAGMEVRAYDPGGSIPPELATESPGDLANRCDVLVLAVPVTRIPDALRDLRPHLRNHFVLDVGSVKLSPIAALSKALGDSIPWVGTHPLFGPTSVALGDNPLLAVVCPNSIHPEAAPRARELYERIGCQVVEMDPDSHDRLMAKTHALAFFVAKGMLDSGVPGAPPVAPPSFQAIARTLEAVQSDATHLFTSIHTENPYASEARRRLLASLESADRALSSLETGEVPTPASGGSLTIPDLGALSPELRAARDLIDELDLELVTLLARRSRLARRAAKVKTELGLQVRDARRETDLLAARREWSRRAGLDPDRVEEVFQAILRFSRTIQDPSAG
jgi:prephenate dehydrogenase